MTTLRLLLNCLPDCLIGLIKYLLELICILIITGLMVAWAVNTWGGSLDYHMQEYPLDYVNRDGQA